MGDPMAPSECEGNSEGGGAEQAVSPWNERKDTDAPFAISLTKAS